MHDGATMLAEIQHRYEVEKFLYHEAALLDERRYSEWFDLFTDDCHYWMPVRQTRPATQLDEEFTKPGEIAFFDDNKHGLAFRVKKIMSPYAWGESPPPRTRRSYANIRVMDVSGQESAVSSNFFYYRSSLDAEVDLFFGRHEHVLRREGESFRIVKRHIFLDQTVITAKNMNQFF